MKRRRRRDFEGLAAVLGRERAFREVVADAAAPVPPLVWQNAVGTRVAARARPTRLERGVLWVTAATAAWSNELSLLSAVIVENLQKHGVAVKELRFRVGPIEPAVRPMRRPPKVAPPPVTLEGALAASVCAVEDDSLRAAIEDAARRSLGFGKSRR